MSLPPPDPTRPARTELPPPPSAGPAPTMSTAAADDPEPDVTPDDPQAPVGEEPIVITPDEVIAEPAGTGAGAPPSPGAATAEPTGPASDEPATSASTAESNLPTAAPSLALVPIPRPDGDGPAPPTHRGLARRWALPAWAWLLMAAIVVAGGIVAVVTRPDDDSQRVSALEEEVRAKDAELTQAQADAQQEAFDDVQEVRDEAEQQLSAAASAREQAEQAAEQADARYTALLEAEIGRVQENALSRACTDADAAGYAQAPKPDPATFGQAEVATLPADSAAEILARLDTAAISAKVDSCYQTGSDRYMSQTTTTTTLPPEPPPDPNAPPPEGAAPAG